VLFLLLNLGIYFCTFCLVPYTIINPKPYTNNNTTLIRHICHRCVACERRRRRRRRRSREGNATLKPAKLD
jgi:hypothetical protein